MPSRSSRSDRGGGEKLTLMQLGAGMVVFGSATPVSKIVTAAAPVFIGSGLRVALGVLTLLPVVLRNRRLLPKLEARDWAIIGLIALFGMFGFSVLMLYGMRMISGVAGAVAMSTTPAITATAAVVFMGERATWRKTAAVGLGVAGILVLQLDTGGTGGGSHPWTGLALVLGAVCCEASYTLLGKVVSERTDPVLVAFLAALLSLPLFVPFAAWQWPTFDPASIDTRSWLAVVWYGTGTLALGSWLWYSGVGKVSGTVAAGFMSLMPCSALILSYVLLDEAFRWSHLAGFGIVFLGVLLISWEHAYTAQR